MILFVATGLILFLPNLALTILLVNALFATFIAVIQLISVITNTKKISPELIGKDPFVSIHIPCHNEPVGILKETLSSLVKLNYSNYEVIVIDNNTHDSTIWHPIQEYCKKLGDRFKFLHFENLAGYKAGALNATLKYVDPRTELICIIDADYIVNKQILRRSVDYFSDPSVAFVQYPQAYYNSSPATAGLEQEYKSFFDNILEQANSWDAVTATGTLSLLRASLFSTTLLKWNEWCITEDTEISMHLHGLGYKGIFINHILGRGLMPFNYYSLQRQRERWVHGNTQIIWKDFLPTIKNKHLNWKQKLSFITQLTAWFHPNLFPILFLTLALLVASWGGTVSHLVLIGVISLLTIMGFMMAKILYFLLGQLRRETLSLSSLAATILTHYGLTGTMSLTWLWALTSPNLPFHRTTKDPTEKITLYIPVDGILAGLFLLGSIIATFSTSGSMRIIALLGTGLGCFLVLAVLFVIWQAYVARNIAHQLIAFANQE